MEQLMTVTDLAQHLCLSVRTIDLLQASGDLPKPVKFGRARRWRPEDIEAWLTERQEQKEQKPAGRPRNTEITP